MISIHNFKTNHSNLGGNSVQVYQHPLVLINGSVTEGFQHFLTGASRQPSPQLRVKLIVRPHNHNQKIPQEELPPHPIRKFTNEKLVKLSKCGHFQVLIHFKHPWVYSIKCQLDGLAAMSSIVRSHLPNLQYEPLSQAADSSKPIIRAVYVLCCDESGSGIFESGRYQVPTDDQSGDEDQSSSNNSIESAKKKISTALLAIQTFYAQSLSMSSNNSSAAGVFNLELNPATQTPIVHLFKIKRSVTDLWQMTQEELWTLLCQELSNSELYIPGRVKFVAFLSFTRYSVAQPQSNTQLLHQLLNQALAQKNGGTANNNHNKSEYRKMIERCRGFASIGGPLLTLIGTPCLYAWSDSVSTIIDTLQDSSPIATGQMNDSRGRDTRGGLYASGLGALAHELGHTFDLGHYSTGVMSRDCDFINEFFLGQDESSGTAGTFTGKLPTNKRSYQPAVGTGSGSAIKWWPKAAQLILAHHKWFSQSAKTNDQSSIEGEAIQISKLNQTSGYSSAVKSLIITAAAGILIIEGRTKSGRVAFERIFQPSAPPRRLTLPTGFLILNKSSKMAPRRQGNYPKISPNSQYNQTDHNQQQDDSSVYELFIMDTRGNVIKPSVESLEALLKQHPLPPQ